MRKFFQRVVLTLLIVLLCSPGAVAHRGSGRGSENAAAQVVQAEMTDGTTNTIVRGGHRRPSEKRRQRRPARVRSGSKGARRAKPSERFRIEDCYIGAQSQEVRCVPRGTPLQDWPLDPPRDETPRRHVQGTGEMVSAGLTEAGHKRPPKSRPNPREGNLKPVHPSTLPVQTYPLRQLKPRRPPARMPQYDTPKLPDKPPSQRVDNRKK